MKVQRYITVTMEDIQELVAKAYAEHGLVGGPVKVVVDESRRTLGQFVLGEEPVLTGQVTFYLLDRPTTESE